MNRSDFWAVIWGFGFAFIFVFAIVQVAGSWKAYSSCLQNHTPEECRSLRP